MPRPSAVSQAYPAAPGRRPQPPADFLPGSPERKFFVETVASVPADHFQPCDHATLVAYTACHIDWLVARGELKASGNMVDGKLNPLIAVVRDLGRTINQLARSLRLNPISRIPLPIKQEAAN